MQESPEVTSPDAGPDAGRKSDAPPGWGTRIRRHLARLCIIYLGVCLLLTVFQRNLIYIPTRENTIDPMAYALPASRIEACSFTGEDGIEVRGWQIAAQKQMADKVPHTERRAAIIFHGNGHHRGGRGYLFQLFNALDCDVFIFDYLGYGETEGSPSETANVANALHQWKQITGEWGYQPDNIVIFGESLGGGVATQAISQICSSGTAPRALILRSTFSSLVDAAGYHYPWLPVRLLLRDRYLSTDAIRNVTCPILVIHGTEDEIVPYELGERLYNAAPAQSASGIPKEMLKLIGADHNNVSHRPDSVLGEGVRAFLGRLE
ncbi:MAG: hypothetical protein CL608_12110 [Anaerolineaceae bacterium]|nr:hypothetical protein [Anaerolineaceae bacterium]